ncbi:bifunctional enoyl-CoA hydratase/phosphate acetyltransferase [Nereida sp. MMG025]|uniref:bifunctional enoyl-CoA hydratase/phosphate acetyltransferase n=1 Tax=Nereida sp. MMG025 TaxID=2909981 RepID=UPI001EFFF5DE|nr:bifunctional enoyl-CoA hydratase/phosphate acetyltransferase [Nereida sp. MMG025]MCF6444719.1 bifunctional enoyl-CoA hydratase/phosphate acetyltransferase [Nereida sp. MMG025]
MTRHLRYEALLERAAPLDPIATAIVAPEEANALGGAIRGAEEGLIVPVLVGDALLIQATAREIGKDISGFEIIDVKSHSDAAARAVQLVHERRVKALMKGYIHTNMLLKHVVKSDGGLRTGRRLSHVFVMDTPGFDRLIMVTDAAINIAPDLKTKADIVQNAIDLGHSLGLPHPKVAVVSAIATINPEINATVEAAALAKMADRGQIKGGLVDGPFAMDNAVSPKAAAIKKIVSPVAGLADILMMPEIQTGNMVLKTLTFMAGAQAGGLVVGAKVPIMLTSRADDQDARVASCVLAALHAHHGSAG